jgi:hypothetical protein
MPRPNFYEKLKKYEISPAAARTKPRTEDPGEE